MACRLVSAEPPSKPKLEYWQLDSWGQTSVKSLSKFKHFHSWKYIWKCRLINRGHFVSASMCWYYWQYGIPVVLLLMDTYSISQEICTRFVLCCALLCLYIDWFSHIHQAYFTSLALWQSNDCPSASKATLMNMDKYFMWIHYERLHNHNKAKHNKTVCIFLGIYCSFMIHGKSVKPVANVGCRAWRISLLNDCDFKHELTWLRRRILITSKLTLPVCFTVACYTVVFN